MAVHMQSNAIYIVQSEIVQLLTPLKRSFKSQTHVDEAQLPLLNSLMQLRDVLANVNALHQVDLSTILAPFLDCIRSEETSGPITAMALSSVNKLLLYGIVDPNFYEIKLVSAAVSNISNAVNHARFVGVDSTSDEVVLLKILQVLRTLLFVNSSSLLTDEDICECLQTCFRICFEARLSELLRKSAESILAEATFMLFSRLPYFKDDVRPDSKKLKLRTGLIDASQKAKRKKKQASPPAVTKHLPSRSATVSEFPPGRMTSATSTPDLSSPDYVMVSPTDLADPEQQQQQQQQQQPAQHPQQPAIENALPDTTSTDSGVPATESTSLKEPTPVPENDTYMMSPYGLSTVYELLRFLIQIISPIDKNNTTVMISLGLNLLTIAFETSADNVSNCRSLVNLVRDELLRNLLFFFNCDNKYTLFVSALRLGFFIYESCRTFLKFQLEIYLQKLFNLITSENGKVSFEYREAALEAVVDLWRVPGLVAELYVNYDCSTLCSNIFEETTKMLAKNAFPLHGLFNTNLLSLEALLTVIDGIEEHCLSRMLNSVSDTSIFGPGSAASVANSSVASAAVAARANLHWRLSRAKSSRMPSLDELLQNRHRKALLQMSIEEFNKKPSKGIIFMQEHKLMSPSATPIEIAAFLKNNPTVDKKVAGEYIGDRKNSAILKAYVEQFSFDGLRIDEALRQFLESFRLPGEAPVIAMIMEQFSEHYFNACGAIFNFINRDAAFTLSYAVIMLNTDQHNTNVRKQSNPMTIDDFKKNVKGCNNGGNFDEEMLGEIYFAVKHEEIVMPEEHTGVVKDKYLWKMALQYSNDPTKSEFLHVNPPGLLDKEVFLLSWRHIVSALSYVYEKTISPHMIQKTLSGFRKCALISAHYNLHEVFDNLLITLCKFTNLAPTSGTVNVSGNSSGMSSGVGSDSNGDIVAIQLGCSQKAMLATKTVFTLAHRHGDVLRDGWRNILDTMCRLHAAQLLPPELEEVEDFVSDTGRISIAPTTGAKGQAESGGGSVFTSLYNYITAGSSASASDPHQNLSPEEREAINLARACVTECHLELLLQDTKFLRLASLHELMKALVRSMIDQETTVGAPNYSGDDVFYLELLIRVVLQNRDRIANIWPMVRDCLFTCILRSTFAASHQASQQQLASSIGGDVSTSAQASASFVVQRAVVGLLRLAVRLMRREEIGQHVVQSLRILLLLSSSVRRHVAEQISFGLYDLVQTNAAVAGQLPTDAWRLVFQLLQIFGAGIEPPYEWTRGLLSELEQDSVFANLLDHAVLPNPVANPEPSSAVPPTNIPSSIIPSSLPANQFTIRVDVKFAYHNPRAFFQCAEALTFLIRDGSAVTLQNASVAVWCLRIFIEAAINGSEQAMLNRGPSVAASGRREDTKRWRSSSTKTGMASPASTGSIDSDDESDQLSSAYQSIALQLLDLVNALHTRIVKIYAASTPANDELLNRMWIDCWLPLLQSTARLCCDRRRQVRANALTYLQRSLLHPDLQFLTSHHWEHAFNAVLFPLLAALLQAGRQAQGLEEARVRACAQILPKVFLQHLAALYRLTTFTALWLTILDFMDCYYKLNVDPLSEAITESLKNILLVMETSGVLQLGDETSQLLKLTWDRLQLFLPHLRSELCIKAPSPVATTSSSMQQLALGGEDQQLQQLPVVAPTPVDVQQLPSSLRAESPPAEAAPINASSYASPDQATPMFSVPSSPILTETVNPPVVPPAPAPSSSSSIEQPPTEAPPVSP